MMLGMRSRIINFSAFADLKLQTARARMESLEERVTRARDDVEEAAESLAELEIQREDLIEPEDLQGQLNESVARRLAAEQSLAAAREAMQGFDTQVRALESERAQTESQLERMREALAEARTRCRRAGPAIAQTEYLTQQSADPVQWLNRWETKPRLNWPSRWSDWKNSVSVGRGQPRRGGGARRGATTPSLLRGPALGSRTGTRNPRGRHSQN